MISEAIDSWEQRREWGLLSDIQPVGPLEPGQMVIVHVGAMTQKLGTSMLFSSDGGVGIVLARRSDDYVVLVKSIIVTVTHEEVGRRWITIL